MKTAGIICEYNPLHTGHLRHISKTREALGGDTAIVCLMSGNYVQRAEPAFIDKYIRAECAVRDGGADLVLELPITVAVASAEGFASGGVEILTKLGVVDHIAFGSEEGDLEALTKVARCLLSGELMPLLRAELLKGLSFAAARQRAAGKLIGDASHLLEDPNNILSIEYIKALIKSGSPLIPMTSKRESDYNSEVLEGFASATAIRAAMRSGDIQWEEFVPPLMKQRLKESQEAGTVGASLKLAERAVLTRLLEMSEADYERLPFGGEGLERRFMKSAREFTELDKIIDATKSKRYAHSRIRRMLLCAWLGLTAQDMGRIPGYVRVLAMDEKGRMLLREMNRRSALLPLTRSAQIRLLSEADQQYYELENRAANLYRICQPKMTAPLGVGEWLGSPVFTE